VTSVAVSGPYRSLSVEMGMRSKTASPVVNGGEH
jgi:hypothetical protein